MTYESWLDAQIRQARERGDFDNLPGTGKPLPDRGELYDEDWWIKQWVHREEITGIVPTSLKIKKEAEELMERLAKESTEAAVGPRSGSVGCSAAWPRVRRSVTDPGWARRPGCGRRPRRWPT